MGGILVYLMSYPTIEIIISENETKKLQQREREREREGRGLD